MNFYEVLETVENTVETYIDSLPKVKADKLGLDSRCGYVWVDIAEGVIISKNSKSIDYYGGFEYIEHDCIYELCDYKCYTSDAERVADALAFYEENLNKEE